MLSFSSCHTHTLTQIEKRLHTSGLFGLLYRSRRLCGAQGNPGTGLVETKRVEPNNGCPRPGPYQENPSGPSGSLSRTGLSLHGPNSPDLEPPGVLPKRQTQSRCRPAFQEAKSTQQWRAGRRGTTHQRTPQRSETVPRHSQRMVSKLHTNHHRGQGRLIVQQDLATFFPIEYCSFCFELSKASL